MYFALVGFENVFDSVYHDGLCYALETQNTHPKYIRIMNKTYMTMDMEKLYWIRKKNILP